MVNALFLAHGSPMMAIENNEYTEFLHKLGSKITPKAIVVFTAHWDSEILTISSTDGVYDTIYDFYGFPEELYKIKYPAKGSSSVAAKLWDKLKEHGIIANKDLTRGLDHGAWTLLMHLYPEADIPVVQVSVNPRLSIEDQVKIGNAIQSFGQEDILVIGSGNTVHNLHLVKWNQTTTDPWAEEFDEWLIEKIKNKDISALSNYRKLAPHAIMAVPTAEHFVPLFITLGSGNRTVPEVIYRTYELGNLSYLGFEL